MRSANFHRFLVILVACCALAWAGEASAQRAVVLNVGGAPSDSDSVRQFNANVALGAWLQSNTLQSGDAFYAQYVNFINPLMQEKLYITTINGVPTLLVSGQFGEFAFRNVSGIGFGGNCPMGGSTTVQTGYWQSYSVTINGVTEGGSVWISTGIVVLSPESMGPFESCNFL